MDIIMHRILLLLLFLSISPLLYAQNRTANSNRIKEIRDVKADYANKIGKAYSEWQDAKYEYEAFRRKGKPSWQSQSDWEREVARLKYDALNKETIWRSLRGERDRVIDDMTKVNTLTDAVEEKVRQEIALRERDTGTAREAEIKSQYDKKEIEDYNSSLQRNARYYNDIRNSADWHFSEEATSHMNSTLSANRIRSSSTNAPVVNSTERINGGLGLERLKQQTSSILLFDDDAFSGTFIPLNARNGGYSSPDFENIRLPEYINTSTTVVTKEEDNKFKPWVKYGVRTAMDIAKLAGKSFSVAEKILVNANVNLVSELIDCWSNECVSTRGIIKNAWRIDIKEHEVWGIDLDNLFLRYFDNQLGNNGTTARIVSSFPMMGTMYLAFDVVNNHVVNGDNTVIKDGRIIEDYVLKQLGKQVSKEITKGTFNHLRKAGVYVTIDDNGRLNTALYKQFNKQGKSFLKNASIVYDNIESNPWWKYMSNHEEDGADEF